MRTGLVFDASVLIDIASVDVGILGLIQANVADVVIPIIVLGEVEALDEPTARALGLTLVESTNSQREEALARADPMHGSGRERTMGLERQGSRAERHPTLRGRADPRHTGGSTMTEPTESREVTLDLTAAEFQLVLSGLRFLLAAESDAEEVDSLKRLIQRLEAR